jgi:Domain of unknown function (DUF5667)
MKYNKQIKKGIKDIKNINLSSDEKEDMFSHIDLYMKENPLKVDSPRVIIFGNFLTQFKSYKYSYSIAFVIILFFISIGAIQASEKALPGDALYPIKTKFVERVISAIKITENSKIEYEEERIVKRLKEVHELAKKGEFKNEKRIQIEKGVENSAKFMVAIKKDNNKNKKNNTDFQNKINTGLDEIKKVYTDIDKTELVNFEEKVKNNLKDVFDHVEDNKINIGL